jgi:hypothetical protein
LYQEELGRTDGRTVSQEPESLTPPGTLPSGEKSVAGFWTPRGELIVKTRREPKALFQMRNGHRCRLIAPTSPIFKTVLLWKADAMFLRGARSSRPDEAQRFVSR